MAHFTAVRSLLFRTTGHLFAPASGIACLTGMSLILLCVGFIESAHAAMDISPLTFRLSVAASMFALAVGPCCLAQVVLSLRRLTRPGVVTARAESATRVRKQSADRELRWTVTSIVALTASVFTLISPELFDAAHWLKSIVQPHFLWTRFTFTAYEGVVLFAAALVPCALLGLLARCAHQVSFHDGRWNFATGGWLLLGVAVGLAILPAVTHALGDGFLMMRVACGPLVGAALISVSQVSRRDALSKRSESNSLCEPEFGQRWPTVLRLAVAVLYGATACAGVVWVYVACTVRMDLRVSLFACSALVLSAAVGSFLAHRRARDANELIGAFGQSAVAAGILLAGAVAVFNLVLRQCDAPFVRSPGFSLLWIVCACVPVSYAAYVVGVGSIAILRRYAFRGEQGAMLLWQTFAVMGVVLLLVAPGLLRSLGSFATLTAAALCMVATGGILIIHGPATRLGLHRFRLAGVFASVLVMMWTMPHLGLGWLSDQQHRREVFVESWWVSFYLDSSGQPRAIHADDGTDDLSARTHTQYAIRVRDGVRESRVGVLDLTGAVLDLLPPALADTADVYSFDVALRRRIASQRFGDSPVMSWPVMSSPVMSWPVMSWSQLRSSPDLYDLLVVSLSDLPPQTLRKTVGRSFLDSVIARLSGDGVLMLLVPAKDVEVVNRLGSLAVAWNGSDRYCGVVPLVTMGKKMASLFVGCGINAESNVREWSSSRLHSPQVLTTGLDDLNALFLRSRITHQVDPELAAPKLVAAE